MIFWMTAFVPGVDVRDNGPSQADCAQLERTPLVILDGEASREVAWLIPEYDDRGSDKSRRLVEQEMLLAVGFGVMGQACLNDNHLWLISHRFVRGFLPFWEDSFPRIPRTSREHYFSLRKARSCVL